MWRPSLSECRRWILSPPLVFQSQKRPPSRFLFPSCPAGREAPLPANDVTSSPCPSPSVAAQGRRARALTQELKFPRAAQSPRKHPTLAHLPPLTALYNARRSIARRAGTPFRAPADVAASEIFPNAHSRVAHLRVAHSIVQNKAIGIFLVFHILYANSE